VACSIKSAAKKIAHELAKAYESQRTESYCYRLAPLASKVCPNLTGRAFVLLAHEVAKALESIGIPCQIRRGAYLAVCLSKRKSLNYNEEY